MDREELEERIRGRRPGDSGFRRGSPVEDASGAGGYVPFQPEPEDALAAREPELPGAVRHVDNMPSEFDAEPIEPTRPHATSPEPPAYEPRVYAPPAHGPVAEHDASSEPPYASFDARGCRPRYERTYWPPPPYSLGYTRLRA